ncbi:SpoVG family protein [Natranaerobius thermophilus]|uniref:SpoVG family protein n=1 Tax=Natranaerobius thermophilus TaxID=375929 RepID=UPI0039C87A9E
MTLLAANKETLEISNIKINLIKDNSKVKALVSLVIEDSLALHGIKVVEGNSGLFVAMPSRKTKDNEYKDIVHPITPEFRKNMQETILEVYHEMSAEPV